MKSCWVLLTAILTIYSTNSTCITVAKIVQVINRLVTYARALTFWTHQILQLYVLYVEKPLALHILLLLIPAIPALGLNT